jgi:hypothetical protein
MNVNIKLSEAAFFMLLTLLATFIIGFQTGKGYAEQALHQPSNNGVVNMH